MTNIEKVWIEMAIAQRSNANQHRRIDSVFSSNSFVSLHCPDSIFSPGLEGNIGLKVASLNIEAGISMRNVLDVLQKDIFNVWNMPDPENDLSDEATHNYPLTDKAVQAIIEHPLSIITAGPTAVIVLFAEWVRGTFRKTSVPPIPPLCGMIIVHQNADGLGTFIQLNADVVIKKIAEIIMENGAKSEQWEVRGEGLDEYWMTMYLLRDS
ncbi:hypothetical protein B0H14DRAFT_2647935 [Mycena olivaceomarginata]|nr:hypothetical protein B0H14DRAFT_2647935 [Mycena olivaceomarginata]